MLQLSLSNNNLDYNASLTGDDIRDFLNYKLFLHLASFKQTTDNPKTINYKIVQIFSELHNKMQSVYALRDVVRKVDNLIFPFGCYREGYIITFSLLKEFI